MRLDPVQAYHILGLTPGASLDEVKAAYRDLAQVWHPDRFPDNDRLRHKAAKTLQRINEAYAVLRDYRPPPTPPASSFPHQSATPPPRSADHRPSAAGPSTAARRSDGRVSSDVHRAHLFNVTTMRRSLKVLWPSTKHRIRPHHRRRRWRRLQRIAWIVLGVLGILAVGMLAVWQWVL